jgi:hypothetical protein
LEEIGADDLQRVKALGYDGGLNVTAGGAGDVGVRGATGVTIQPGDILVGLHAWPTTSMKALAEVLNRDDLIELNPLKFYVVRQEMVEGNPNEPVMGDVVRTGRVTVNIDHLVRRGRTSRQYWYWQPSEALSGEPVSGEPLVAVAPPLSTGVPVPPAPAAPAAPADAAPAIEVAPPAETPPVPPEPPAAPSSGALPVPTIPRAQVPTPTIPRANVPVPTIPRAELQGKGEGSTFLAPPQVMRVPSTEYRSTPNATPARAQAATEGTDSFDVVTVERTTPDGRTVYETLPVPRTTVTTPAQGAETGRSPDPDGAQKPNLRYDGKTFDEWRNAWQTELSTAKRLEAVKALAAFGANGYGKDAAEAILEVAGQYDWTSIGGNKMIEPLQNACVEALAGPSFGEPRAVPQRIPVGDAMPAISAAARSGNQRQKMFLTYVLPYLEMPESIELRLILSKDQDATVRKYALPTLPTLGYDGHDEKVSARIREALKSDDPDEVAAAMRVVWPSPNPKQATAGEPYPYLEELGKWIFSPHAPVRKQARNLATSLKGADATHMTDVALAVLKDDSKKEQHIEAIRALAALGPNAKSAVDTLRPLVKSENQPIAVATNFALTRILRPAEYNRLLYDELGKRFELGWEVEGRSLGRPSGEKQEEYEAFQRAANDELRQVFP